MKFQVKFGSDYQDSTTIEINGKTLTSEDIELYKFQSWDKGTEKGFYFGSLEVKEGAEVRITSKTFRDTIWFTRVTETVASKDACFSRGYCRNGRETGFFNGLQGRGSDTVILDEFADMQAETVAHA